jgi:DNA-binding CsgD family transcriptional regulator
MPRVDERAGWVLLPEAAVPERWRSRAIAMWLVPLLPDEAEQILEEGRAEPGMTPAEEAVACLVARGMTVDAIARQLRISPRSVNRRLASLRERIGVASTAELAAALASRGF